MIAVTNREKFKDLKATSSKRLVASYYINSNGYCEISETALRNTLTELICTFCGFELIDGDYDIFWNMKSSNFMDYYLYNYIATINDYTWYKSMKLPPTYDDSVKLLVDFMINSWNKYSRLCELLASSKRFESIANKAKILSEASIRDKANWLIITLLEKLIYEL